MTGRRSSGRPGSGGDGSNRRTRSRREAGIGAARDARRHIAGLIEVRGEDEPELARSLSTTVGLLFGAEIGDNKQLTAALGESLQRLQDLLEAPRWADDDEVARALSRACAMLHPAYVELSRAGRRRDNTQPFLLTPHRIKASEPPADNERRQSTRSEMLMEVGLEGANRFYTGQADDLSRGGVFVATDDPLPVGTEVTLSFVLPDGHRIAAAAAVAWVRAPRYRPDALPAGMGVRFEGLPSEDVQAIQNTLESRPAFHYGD